MKEESFTSDDLRDMLKKVLDGRTRVDMARKIGVSPTAISQFLNGETGPGPATIKYLGMQPIDRYEFIRERREQKK